MPKKKEPKIHELKVILVGKTGAGKTNLINVLIGAKFQQSSLSTTVSNFVEKKMTIENKKYNLEIWDTAGQEKFHSLSKLFIKESRVVLLVYDITDKSSFEDINFWFDLVKEVLGNKFVLGLAGNKKDLFLKEIVSESEGQKKAEEIGATFKFLKGNKKEYEKLRKERIELCRKNQDMSLPNFGSVFKKCDLKIMEKVKSNTKNNNKCFFSAKTSNWLLHGKNGTFKDAIKEINKIKFKHIINRKKCKVEVIIWK